MRASFGSVFQSGNTPAGVTQYMDPTKVGARYTLVGNTVTATDTNARAFVPAAFPLYGNTYWEVVADNISDYIGSGIGVVGTLVNYAGAGPFDFPSGVGVGTNDRLFGNGSSFGGIGLGACSNGDVMMFAFNQTTRRFYYGKNGVWDIDPEASIDAGTWFSYLTSEYYICVRCNVAGDQATVRFEEADFTYAIPAGYLAARASFDVDRGTTAGGGTDPYWDDVVFLDPWGDDADASTPTPEDSTNTLALTYVGTAEVDTAQAPGGGDTTSSLLVGTGNYVTWDGVPMGVLQGDFTVECYLRFSSFSGWDGPVGDFHASRPGSWGFLRNGSSNVLVFEVHDSGLLLASSTALAINTDYHIAASRSGLTTRLFIDGALEATDTETFPCSVNARVSTNYAGRNGFGDPMSGWISELRITNAARYTAAFTAPTGLYPRS